MNRISVTVVVVEIVFAAIGLAAIEFSPIGGITGGSYEKTKLGKLFYAILEETPD